MCAAIGANNTVNYCEGDLTDAVRALTGKAGVDVVIDPVGGDLWKSSVESVRRGGRIVVAGNAGGDLASLSLIRLFEKELHILGSNSATRRDLRQVVAQFEIGRLKPYIDRVFNLIETDEALRYADRREQFGKVVLRIADD